MTCTSFQSLIMSSIVSLDLIHLKEGFRTWNRQNSNSVHLEDNESDLHNKVSLIYFSLIQNICVENFQTI